MLEILILLASSANTPTTFMVSPLRPVLEMEQNDEICERDLVVLIGKYVRVFHGRFRRSFVLTNLSSLSLDRVSRLKAS